jgi:hypothetical protein
MRVLYIACLAIFLLMLNSCKKEEQPTISEAPSITLLSVSSTTVQEFQDSLVFSISYTDGDGDLGVDDADSTVIELIDNRDPANLVFGYHLSPRAPAGSSLIVQGELQIVLDNVIILNSSANSETTTFDIRIKDRAQQWSNVVTTEEITIQK